MLSQHNMRRAPLILALLLLASTAQAQTISAVSPNPVAGVPFIVHGTVPGCNGGISGVTVNGSNIDISVTPGANCIDPLPSVPFDVLVGPLPVGTYTIRLLWADNSGVMATAPVMVVADVPALDPRLLAMLAATMVVIAIVRLGVR